MMFSQQRYLRELLAFAELRVREAGGEAITEEQLRAVFHQPFARLTEEDHREAAERPVSQVRLAIEVLRRLLNEEEISAEAEYREAALDSLLAHWGLSHGELQEARTRLQHDEGEAAAIVESLAQRLGVGPERVEELLLALDDLTEDKLEELFGLPSTQGDPLAAPDAPPKLLLWQRERLPEVEGGPAGRGTREARSVREQSEQTLKETLQAAAAAAEAEALPRLRDVLVAAAPEHDTGEGEGRDRARVVNSLTRRLALDFGTSGQVQTTRLRQAAETLQTVLSGLRTGWFAQRQRFSVFSDSHPVAGWEIAFDDAYSRADFDEDWHWLGQYEMWRSAFQTLVYPDAALLPSLLEDSSPDHRPSRAFRTLIHRLRTASRLTPRQARQLANGEPEIEEAGYLTMLRDEAGDELPDELHAEAFVITEQLKEKDLLARQREVRRHFEPDEGNDRGTGRWLHDAPNWLKEIYYFVPLTLALHLQRSGHFLAALAWYRTIYAYDWEAGQRKIFYGLVLEEELPLIVHRDSRRWLRERLNPHETAARRGHAYTRFTLQSIIGCFLDFADAEFTAATTSPLARARSLYLTALDLLELPEMVPPEDERAIGNPLLGGVPAPESSAIRTLRQHAELSLGKLRSGRNIAGMEQPQRMERAAEPAAAPFLRTVVARPTIYRYQVLIERAQQLVGIAQQVEASFLSSAEKADAEAYSLLQAQQDLALSEEQVELQDLRVAEAGAGIELARLQRERARLQRDGYQAMLDAGLMEHEAKMLDYYQKASAARREAAEWEMMAGTVSAFGSLTNPVQALTFLGSTIMRGRQLEARTAAMAAETRAQVASIHASNERREQEWRRQRGLAEKEIEIGAKQIGLARQRQDIAMQERGIARLQTEHAANTLGFLANKFTNAELYEWMSGVLNRVYRFFLQQAIATALLAQNQLAFERQEKLPGFIQQDYWRPPAEGEAEAGGDGGQPDRRGLTGSARLLQDIFKLDQFAFKTRERKLELSQTFSLARLFPFEFEQFRQTGRLPFFTSMEFFDRGFPGHYLRLIKRVSVSVLALVPPSAGIRATLANSGISRVVIGPDVFRTVEVQRSPELIAFTSPMNATGLFTLEPEGELLLPFEGQGVDTTWQLEMPRAANAFDYRTVADVLVMMDYTAQYSASYRRQVISQLDRSLEAERPFSFRQQFLDAWYDLHNSRQAETPMKVHFTTRPEDFPANLADLRIRHVLLYFVPADGASFEIDVDLAFTSQGSQDSVGGPARSTDGIISTRRANAEAWRAMLGSTPVGRWELTLTNTDEVRDLFRDERIEDILFVMSYEGQTPVWPS